MKRWLKWLLKIAVTAAALYLTFRKVNWQQTREWLLSANMLWLLAALLCYNASQLVSARRLLYFYRALGLPLSYRLNLALYYKGMFYNLFLPGGIGGDGYKVHFLFRQYKRTVKKLVTATLLDRFNGLVVLGLLAVILAGSGLLPDGLLPFPPWCLVLFYLGGMTVYLWLLRSLFAVYFPIIPKAVLLAAAVQSLQLLATLCIMAALQVSGAALPYLLLFLASSIAAVIPFTVGGMGARELVFMSGAPLLGIAPEQAVAVSLLFFLLTTVSSLAGAFVKVTRQPLHPDKP